MIETPTAAYVRELHDGLYSMLTWQHRRVLHERATSEGSGKMLGLLWYLQEKLPPCECWGCVLWRTDSEAAEEATTWVYKRWSEEAREREQARLLAAWGTMSPEERRHSFFRAVQTESDVGWPQPADDDEDWD